MKKKLVIMGASGFLGWHLVRLAAEKWEVYAFTHNHEAQYPGINRVKCDITNYIESGDLLNEIEPDALIHTAAIADAEFCQTNREISFRVNVEASSNIAGICSDFNIPFAFTSTDLVFDGTAGIYCETDKRNPLSIYAEHKASAEDEVLKIYPQSAIFRLPLMPGHPAAGTNNYLRKFVAQASERKNIQLFIDEYRSAAGAKSIALGILKLFENFSGIIHLGGRERLSRYEIGQKIITRMKLSGAQITPCSQKDVKTNAPRPADVSMDISKALALGYNPLLLDEELKLIANNKYIE